MYMRKIAVVSATRAEWYLLKNLCYEIEKDEDLSLQLFVSGTHLSKDFGLTYKEIQKEFKISKKIKILSKKNDSPALCKSLSKTISKFSKVFAKFKPDIVVILGDRYEMLGVASAALLMRIPIAHICGGELTLGAIDDSIRHSISKMASLHFVSTNTYRKRVLQLGEQEDRVFTVGSLGAENIARMNFLSKEELEKELKLRFEKRIFLITYHPQTLNLKDTKRDLELLLAFLEKQKDTSLIFTKANA
ncbi:UDP-N-acetylglucosamine 2-epimerase, partial [Campylobacter avium]